MMKMISRPKFSTSSLNLPQGVFVSASQLRQMCGGISASTLERHRNDLIDLGVARFQYTMYSGVYDSCSAECIWQYRQLITQVGLPIAQTCIRQHLEDFFSDK